MKRFKISLILLCLCICSVKAQEFTVKGKINIPDGYTIGLCCNTDTSFAEMMGEDILHDGGQFFIKGTINHPQPGTLMTNNLDLVEKNHWPMDSIHWTYNDIMLSAGELYVTPDLKLMGTQVQDDYNEWLRLNPPYDPTLFIYEHPHSVVSLWLANNILQRGYNLTKEQVDSLEMAISNVPDSLRNTEFRKRISYAKRTTKGSKLLDVELLDSKGKVHHLVDIVPKNRFVLVDFWASWCGICIGAMPEIRNIEKQYKDKFSVIAVSIDRKEDAWKRAMRMHPEPWPQYMTTKKGYQDVFDKYQVGNGVPYYLIITPDGTVLNSPSTPAAVREVLEQYN